MNFFRKSALILKHLGPDWAAFRVRYALERRTGALKRRSPLCRWDDIDIAPYAPEWLIAPVFPQSGKAWGGKSVEDADGIAIGEYILFSHHQKVLGCPPDWHRNALTGQVAPRGRHWSDLGDFDFGDIKAIWELSRFGWAVTLARAHARTKEGRIAELFWRLFEDWCAQNPPNTGVNWKCGQESSFRLFAAAFALAEFRESAETTPQRLVLWSRFVTATGRRVLANLEYALSQSNNHGVSECIGLVTSGALSKNSSEAQHWRSLGMEKLRAQLDDLVYADGGFSQHSLIYHRVLLHDLFWMISLLQKSGEEPPEWLIIKARAALEFAAKLVDADSGAAPVYGTNDGANIFPFDDCAFDDLRGVVQAGYALLDGVRIYPPGPWDETVLWFSGKDPVAMPLRQAVKVIDRCHAPEAGCFQWLSGGARLFLRCPTHFRHRPSQADMLHVSLFWRGAPIAIDAGTFSNNMPAPFGGAFGMAAAHSVPMLLGCEPLEKAGRFLYLPWPEGTAQWSDSEKCFNATHTGYGDSCKIFRSIKSPNPGVFEIMDSVTLSQPHKMRIHWLLADAGWSFDAPNSRVSASLDGKMFIISWQSATPSASVTLHRADTDSARGWWSRHYLAVEPAVSLELIFDLKESMEIVTRFAPEGA